MQHPPPHLNRLMGQVTNHLLTLVASRGRAVRSTRLKLWCLQSEEFGFESKLWQLCHWPRNFTIIALSFEWEIRPLVLCTKIGSGCKRTKNTYRGLECSASVFLVHMAGTLAITVIKFTYEATLISLPEVGYPRLNLTHHHATIDLSLGLN